MTIGHFARALHSLIISRNPKVIWEDATWLIRYSVPPYFTPTKIAHSRGTSLYQSNALSFRPTQPTTTNSISVESAVFPKYTVGSNR